MTPAVVFELERVSKTYPQGILGRRRLTALDNVSLRAQAGEAIGLVGPNRAGKSTLIKILLALAAPTSGSGKRFGKPLSKRQTLARVGYVHESAAFPRYLNAREVLHLGAAFSLMQPADIPARVAQLLESVGLHDRPSEPISTFSKGMLQRLGLAQALLNDPELLVMDEPAESLDANGRHLLHSLIREQHQRGRTVLLVSHHLEEVETLCDRVVALVGGRIVLDQPMTELRRTAAKQKPRFLREVLQPFYSAVRT
ncbi:MAG TPA: ABC transporter ATP-binding protein [Gemmataceae bacterium]|nr:ABC transporter ATP-binding protein [Gemmataceae bacterium]